MTEVLLEKYMGGAVPASDDAHRVMSKIPNGSKFVADIRDPSRRSTQQHNYCFALLNILFESQELYPTLDAFRWALLIHLGHCDVYPRRDGDPVAIPRSMAPGKMPQDEFNSFIDEILAFAEGMGFDRKALTAEARQRLGPVPIAQGDRTQA